MKKLIEEFKKFINRGNVIDMAIGVTVASAFTAVVTAFTKSFISPLLALLTDGADLSALKWVIRPALLDADGETVKEEVAILFGTFLQALIDFFIIALVLFFILKTVTFLNKKAEAFANDMKDKLQKGDAPAAEAEEAPAAMEAPAVEAAPAPVSEEIALLREIRDALLHKNEEE